MLLLILSMLPLILFAVALICSVGKLFIGKEKNFAQFAEIFLSYLLLLNLGVMSLLAAYAHIFEGPATAAEIGWSPGSPFQFEMGVTNLSFGVLGVLAFWKRGAFWDACVIGWCVTFIGCFVGHIRDYYTHHNTAPYNIGPMIWMSDLILPILALTLLIYQRIALRN